MVISFSEAFLKENIDNIPEHQLPLYGYTILIAVFCITFLVKYSITGVPASNAKDYQKNSKKKNILVTILVSIQAIAYSMTFFAEYIISNDYLLYTKFVSMLIGFALSIAGALFSDSP